MRIVPASKPVSADTPPSYIQHPSYLPEGGEVQPGWESAVASLPEGPLVLALDGPAVLNWKLAVEHLAAEWSRRHVRVKCLSTQGSFLTWKEVQQATSSTELADDPDFAKLAAGSLADLFGSLPQIEDKSSAWIIYGPGAGLIPHDVLWYADLPKRFAEEAVKRDEARNLAQPEESGPGTTKRLYYVDWPLLDRHRDAISGNLSRWIDLRDPVRPTSLDGAVLRRTLARLARQPFRTQPTFNSAPWGGHWAQRVLHHNPVSRNTALGYELIAPESGVLVGSDTCSVEIPFGLVVTRHPRDVLGVDVHAAFGTSFPIRFDYLDTMDGGNLSVHCHPQAAYMRDVFGWPYTQHETYYVVDGDVHNKIFLGLRPETDVEAFTDEARRAEKSGHPMDIEQYVQTFPATPHHLFLIPAGTPHGSGAGNVVLEVSATPYLYSLRLYDWLRQDSHGNKRPTHVDHAFRNLNMERVGDRVQNELIQEPWTIRQGDGWYEEVLGVLPEMFFEVRRLVLAGDTSMPDDTRDRFHVLNVVDGAGAQLEMASGQLHILNRFETLLVPAATGRYQLRARDGRPTRIVKALVR
jgi:mannose-6-phosphate isomerase class I